MATAGGFLVLLTASKISLWTTVLTRATVVSQTAGLSSLEITEIRLVNLEIIIMIHWVSLVVARTTSLATTILLGTNKTPMLLILRRPFTTTAHTIKAHRPSTTVVARTTSLTTTMLLGTNKTPMLSISRRPMVHTIRVHRPSTTTLAISNILIRPMDISKILKSRTKTTTVKDLNGTFGYP
jgi:hypothetical protein